MGLQELKVEEGKFPHLELEAEGYRVAANLQKAWNGVAVLSRQEPLVRQRGLPGQDEMGARLVSARVADLTFVTIYCPNGKSVGHEDFPRKLQWLDSLQDWIVQEHDPDDSLILCGDFNICPAALDSWNEEGKAGSIFHTEEERSRFGELINWGLVDLFRAKHPDLQKFSWWDYRAGAFHRNQGLRIDFLLATRPVMERVRSVEIDRDYRKKKEGLVASDHAPVVAELTSGTF